MAKNDKILIDGIIDDRIDSKIPSDKRDEAFEYFAFEQILKDYDLSTDEIIQGSIDGRNDGGIDGFFIFVNGHFYSDTEKFNWPKSGSLLEIWIITCKHHDTFRQAPLDNLAASISELFDLAIEDKDLKSDYSDEVLNQRENFKYAYRKVSPRLSEFNIKFCYASRGNTEELGESIVARANQIKQITNDSFANCNANFHFYGSTELIELHRKSPNFTLELPFSDDLSNGETYVLLVKLKDYFKFITDGEKLRRYLFDSNVRDFMGLNRVNEDIRDTLLNDESPDFWWLNNGVTILATGARVVGKSILIEDIQIVNGLQTSESIFRYFSSQGNDISNRSVLVKVIVSNNSEIRDKIIRATNNQTFVEVSALHATDKIQRDIEEVLKLEDFFYERRTNYYKNQGMPLDRIVTPLYIASGFINLILKSPEQSTVLKSRFMRHEKSYEHVFSESTDLQVWPKIAFILKKTDDFLEKKRPSANSVSEHFIKFRRQFLSFLTISRILDNFNFSTNDLVKFNSELYCDSEIELTWKLLVEDMCVQFSKSKLTRNLFLEMCKKLNANGTIIGFDRLENNYGINFNTQHFRREQREKPDLSQEFIEQVYSALPTQPWKPGIHKVVAEQLKCPIYDIFSATDILIQQGKFLRQKDGILYDNEGKITGIDTDRVNIETLTLKD